jgi:methionyl-tRNA synthetase
MILVASESCQLIFVFFLWILRYAFLFQYKVLCQLNLSTEDLSFSEEKGETAKGKSPWDFVPAGHKIGKPAPLFKELVCVCCSEILFFQLSIILHI